MKNTQITSSLAAFTAIFATCDGLNAASLLGNSGFESPLLAGGADATTGNWSAFTGGPDFPDVSTAAPFAGTQHLSASIQGADATFVGIQQNFDNLVIGTDYTFSLQARGDGAIGLGAEFRIEWLDAAGGFVVDQFANNVDFSANLTDTYQLFTQTSAAPVGAEAGRAVFALQTFGGGTDTGTVFLDNADVDGLAVPEPTAGLLCALTGLGLVLRRRR